MNKKPSGSLTSLLATAKEKEKEVQDIKNVTPGTETKTIDSDPIEKVSVTTNATEKKVEKDSMGSIDYFFEEIKIKSNEVIRITPEIHAQLKTLAAISGTTITMIAVNIINKVLEDNKNEILKYKKKNI